MPSTKIARITGITSPHEELLDVFSRQSVEPSPVSLFRARIDLATAPLHIEACLKQTLEATPEVTNQLKEGLGTSDLQEAQRQLLNPITQAWHPSKGGRWSGSAERNIIPRQLPQAVQDFRLRLKRYDIPITDNMEVALTEALASAMCVLEEDNALLEKVAKAYDNNTNYRHEVGRIVGIREVALSGDFG